MVMINTEEFEIEIVQNSKSESPLRLTSGDDMVSVYATHKPSGLLAIGETFIVPSESPTVEMAIEASKESAINNIANREEYIKWDAENHPQITPKKRYDKCKKISITVECDGVDHFMLVPDEFLRDNFNADVSKYVSKLTIIERKENGEVREYRLSKGEVK